MTKNFVNSEENFLNLGFNRWNEKHTFYKPSLYQSYETKKVNEEVVYRAFFQMDMTVIEHSRSIYTYWDFLGDVGGLFGILQSLAYPLIALSSLLLNTGIDQFLIESLFKV